jgi:type II secretory pathway pseudopilin PulG
MKRESTHPSGVTLIEILVTTAVTTLLLGLVFSAVQSAREAARRTACANHFRQIGVGLHNYHAAYGFFPSPGGTGAKDRTRPIGTDYPSYGGSGGCNQWRLNILVPLLPFVEEQPLWEKVSNPYVAAEGTPFQKTYSPMGPIPWHWDYPVWKAQVSTYRCPSDASPTTNTIAKTNYASCAGDGIWRICAGYGPAMYAGWPGSPVVPTDNTALRGMVHRTAKFGVSDCIDGGGQTLLMGEIAGDDQTRRIIGRSIGFASGYGVADLRDRPSRCLDFVDPSRPRYWKKSAPAYASRGGRWTDYASCYSVFNTVLPPNGPNCSHEVGYPQIGHSDQIGGVFSASSNHPGGCHVLLVDGVIKFVSETVDAGNSSAPSIYSGSVNAPGSESPYGVWGAMGTRGSHESRSL